MATYNIDKITLPSGDVCNLTIPDASAVQAGKVNIDTTTAQLFRGHKVFDSDTITVANGSTYTTHNYSQIQFNDKTFSSDPDTGNGTRAGYIAVGRPALGSSSGNIMRFMIRSPLSDGTGYTSYYDSFTLPAPSAGNTDHGWYSILTTKNTKTYTASLTTAGWSSNTQTVTVTGMTADAIIMVSAAPASEATYRQNGVYCSAQAANSLTFKCASTPTAAITVNILTIG